jgi:hypothetical protein
MTRVNHLIAGCLLALTAGAANANSITTFDVDASFGHANVDFYHTPQSLTGTLTVDVTTGVVTGANLTVPGFSTFTTIVNSYEFFAATWTMTLANAGGSILDFLFYPSPAPTGAQLVGLTAGLIAGGELYVGCSPLAGLCHTWGNWESYGLQEEYFGGNSLRGTLNPQLMATPLPAALPLFATGLGVIGLLALRRKRKGAAALAA